MDEGASWGKEELGENVAKKVVAFFVHSARIAIFAVQKRTMGYLPIITKRNTMTFIENLTEYLKKEGFCPETTEFGLQFKFQTLDFIHFRDEQDELFLNIFFPQIFEVTAKNRADVLEALDKANAETKVAKGCVRFDNAVWAGVEMLLSENYDLTDIVPRALNMMIYYRDVFYHHYSQTPSGKAEMAAAQAQQG